MDGPSKFLSRLRSTQSVTTILTFTPLKRPKEVREMDKSFYVTLSSNVDSNIFPDNALTHFFNKLPYTVDLSDDDWEVGLAEIQFPFNWHNVQRGEIYMTLETERRDFTPGLDGEIVRDMETAKLHAGHYATPQTLVEYLNKMMSIIAVPSLQNTVTFRYLEANRRISIRKKENVTIKMSPKLLRILGFRNYDPYIVTHNARGDEEVDVSDGLHHLFVYTNAAEYRIVGHSLLPLLRIVPVDDVKPGANKVVKFENVHYIPARRQLFEALEINITSTTGQPIPFERGQVLVTLHFRRSS